MWLVNSVKSLRSSREGLQGRPYDSDGRPRCTNVLTPETIPEFLIPTTELPSRKRSDSSNNSEASFGLTVEDRFLAPSSLPGYDRDSDAWSYVTPPRSPAVSPYRTRRSGVVNTVEMDTWVAAGPDTEMDSNADPLSLVGMTLQHLGRTRTSYGFTTLTSSPTTNRKESLYFANGKSSKQKGSSPLVITPESDSDGGWRDTGTYKRRSTASSPSGYFHNPSSSESSPVSSPASSRSRRSSGDASSVGKKSPKVPKYVRRQRFQTRRRSSLAVPIDFSSTDPSSTEPSPNVPRKTSPWGGHSPVRQRSNSLQVPSFTPYALRESNGQDRPGPGEHYLGELKFAIEFVKRGRQLKVSIIKAENLGGHKHAKNNVNSYIRLYLLPGKVGRQQTRTVKHTRNPIFNEEFYFGGLGLQMLNDMKLRMKVFSKTPHLRRDELLGEVQVVLGTLDLSHENRLWRNLEPKTEAEDLGMLNVSLCYQPKTENLIVTVIKAEDLPRNSILTPPDPYVKIVLSGADGGEDDARQTRIRRKTSNPVFKEAFSLHIPHGQVKTASVTATVYDHARIISDGVIGQVRFGATATELSEIEHLRRALDQENQPITFWHNLMEPE